MPSTFFDIATSIKSYQSIIVQKFTKKYCFKGNWDSAGKMIKWVILNNEKTSTGVIMNWTITTN